MNITTAICNFCDEGRLVIKLPVAGALMICVDCVDDLRRQLSNLALDIRTTND